MNEKLKLAMTRMGYRDMGNGQVWAKPVAYHLYTIRMIDGVAKFTNYFLGAQRQMLVWNSQEITDTEDSGGYELSIKYAEYGTRCDVGNRFDSDFGFASQAEVFATML